MPCRLEYHGFVRASISATVASFALITFSLCASARAQVNGPPSSVTSPGFGGRPINGTAPSVTSVGPRGYAPSINYYTPNGTRSTDGHRTTDGHHHRRRSDGAQLYAYPVPYAVDLGQNYDDADAPAEDPDADQQGGPTIFDRRGSGASSYVPPVKDVPRAHSVQTGEDDAPADPTPRQRTIIVFKDGHQLELDNYAIIGSTLFDLTPGHPRRVELATLDLDATRKQNDDRGVNFQLPPPATN